MAQRNGAQDHALPIDGSSLIAELLRVLKGAAKFGKALINN